MFLLWSVARLAVDVHMLAALLLFQNVRVAVFASLVAGVVHGTSGDFGYGISAVVSVLSETLRHKERTHSYKRQAANDENSGHPK
jgi:predicted RNA methylase